jgi:hypothetical protein
MNAAAHAIVAQLEAAAKAAQQAEDALRKRMVEEVARLERERAFAYRRLNLMRAVADAVARAESQDAAVANGLAAVRNELGWDGESETRTETLDRFAAVIRATFARLGSETAEAETPAADPVDALSDFEAWYAARFERPFWVLFDQYVPELPLVER